MNKKLLSLILMLVGVMAAQATVTLNYNSTSAEMNVLRDNIYWLNVQGGSSETPTTGISVTVDGETYGAAAVLGNTESATLAAGTDKVSLNDAINGSSSLDFFFDTDSHEFTVVDGTQAVYIRSKKVDWGFNDDVKMSYGNGVYSIWFKNLDETYEDFSTSGDGFVISNGDWSVKYGVASSDAIDFSTTVNAVSNGENIKLTQTPSYFAVEFDAVAKTVKVVVPLYLRGSDFGSYNPQEQYRFKPFQDYQNTYVLDFGTDTQITGKFKIADDNWTEPYNFGNAYGNGLVQQLSYSPAGDVDASNSRIGNPTTDKLYATLYKDNNNTKCCLYMGLPKQIYIIGWENNWSTSNPPVTMTPNAATPWIYESPELSFPGDDTTLAYNFRIFDNTSNNDYYLTSWGHNGTVDGYEPTFYNKGQDSETLQLLKGWSNNIKIERAKREGPFTIRFNLFNGQMTIHNADTSSVSELAANATKVVVNGGVITAGDKLMNVYTVSGALVAANAKSVAAARGLYIVVVDGAAQKVVVR